MIKVMYFAGLREQLGVGNEALDLPQAVRDVGGLQAWLASRGGDWEALQTTPNLQFAVNQEMVRAEGPVRDGDEVAFFPPVTGG